MSVMMETFITAKELANCAPRTSSIAMGIEASNPDVFALAMVARTEHYPLPVATVMTFEKPGVAIAAEFACGLIQKTVDSGIRVPLVIDAFSDAGLQKKLTKAGADVIALELTAPNLDVMTRELRYRIQSRAMLIAEDDKLRTAFARTFVDVNAGAHYRAVKRDRLDNIDPVYALMYAVYAEMLGAR